MKKLFVLMNGLKFGLKKMEEKVTAMKNGFNTILSNFSSTLLFLFLSLLEFSWPVLEKVIGSRWLLWNKREVLLEVCHEHRDSRTFH